MYNSVNILTFEDFLEESWDYVSSYVIDDDDWDNNFEFIKETTFDIYQLYLKSVEKTPDGLIYTTLTPKLCGKMLESFLSNLIKHKFQFKDFG